MGRMEMETHSNVLSRIVSEIKNHKGSDPLLPWLQGIRKMKDLLPPPVLKEKLPRFLQKCARTFESDRVYRDDDRYLRVWLQLMDFVDDPGNVLKTMETNRIGKKRSLFYQAYALYYEKLKKFNEAEKMYHNGVNNLAQPSSDLHTSYEQFLLRLERHKLRKPKLNGRRRPPLGRATGITTDEKTEVIAGTRLRSRPNSKKKHEFLAGKAGAESYEKPFVLARLKEHSPPKTGGEETVCKFVGSASQSEEPVLENACHHGLVEPTVNLKEAMSDINNMFGKPIEFRRHSRRQRERSNSHGSSFSILPDSDDDCDGDAGRGSNHGQNLTRGTDHGSGFTILTDEENEFVLKEPGPSSLERSGRDGDLFEPTACTKDVMDDINKLFGMPLNF